MPRSRASAAATKPTKDEKLLETEEQVEIEETSEEEEVEYEEIEEETEEEEEIEEEVEVEEEDEEENDENGHDARKRRFDSDEDMDDSGEEKRHAELLALPPQGSEIYVGGISLNTSEDDLKNFCESIGEVTEVRVMKGKESYENKGYAFVTFRTIELASKAIIDLNNKELKGIRLRCSTSQAKNKLFIGNVPRTWGEEDMKKVVNKVGPGVIAIELLKVKAVYVKNLPKNVTQEQLMELFERHGEITKVVLPPAKPGKEESRYGFVHFAERSNAMKALKNTEKFEIDGQVAECSLAKPQADQKTSGGSNAHKPLMYGRGSPGMAMMPMLLPDGRIGYVLQQPGGLQPHTPPPLQQRGGHGSSSGGRRVGSSSGSGRRGSDSGGRGRDRYNPY